MSIKTEESALYDSQSNGLAESSVKDAKDAVRTNLACLIRRFGQDFTGEHPVLSWLVKYSVAMVNRVQERSRWQDSLRVAQGAQIRKGTAAFYGEDSLHDSWSHEGWLRELNRDGRTESSWVCLIGAMNSTLERREACNKVRTLRRREATERFDLTFLNNVTARPWDGQKSAREVRVVVA